MMTHTDTAELTRAVRTALLEAGAGACAFLTREALDTVMTREQVQRLDTRVPGWQGIVCIVVPYYVRDEEETAEQDVPRISRYARGKDYHVVVGEILRAGLAVLEAAGYRGDVLVDASPIPEVRAAAMGGLGVIGRNGLLLTEDWGSWVFVGCLATDAPMEFAQAREIRGCMDCGACIRACPAGALRDGRVDAALCLSDLSQRSGELSPREEQLLREHGILCGCDRCQGVCPANRCAQETQIAAFRENLVHTIPESILALQSRRELLQAWPGRAFTWKGVRVLQRNLGLFVQDWGMNKI